MLNTFKKYVCSNCKGKCEKGIVIISDNGITKAKCIDYEKKEKVEGYKKQEEITARKQKALMRLNI